MFLRLMMANSQFASNKTLTLREAIFGFAILLAALSQELPLQLMRDRLP